MGTVKTAVSPDGTSIAFEQSGRGPNLVIAHGTGTFRAPWAAIFAKYFTVSAMNRRGRGDSGDNESYAIEREFEDIAAVVSSLTPPTLLFGHSFGALCALGAALLTKRLAALVLYEPWIYGDGDVGVTREQLERLEAHLVADDRESVLRVLYAEVVGMLPADVDVLVHSPAWPARVETAPTIPRELRAEKEYRFDEERLAALATPTLLVLGGDSPTMFWTSMRTLERALPNARIITLPGQQHIAMYTAPDLLVGAVLDFWHEIQRPA